MKSEHRHELQTNDLSKLIDRIGPFFEVYGNRILLGLAAAILLLAGGVWWSKTSTERVASAWAELLGSGTPEELFAVAEDHEGTTAAGWARLQAAEGYLFQGLQTMFTHRSAAVAELEKAKEAFSALLADKGISDRVRERALIGLARTLETLSGRDTQPAIGAYEKFVAEFPDSIYAEMAGERAKALKTGGAQEFYAWFAEQNPQPEDRSLPQDGPQDAAAQGTSTVPTDPFSGTGLGPLLTPNSSAAPSESSMPDAGTQSGEPPASDVPSETPGAAAGTANTEETGTAPAPGETSDAEKGASTPPPAADSPKSSATPEPSPPGDAAAPQPPAEGTAPESQGESPAPQESSAETP